jgi:hypothetical protein
MEVKKDENKLHEDKKIESKIIFNEDTTNIIPTSSLNLEESQTKLNLIDPSSNNEKKYKVEKSIEDKKDNENFKIVENNKMKKKMKIQTMKLKKLIIIKNLLYE